MWCLCVVCLEELAPEEKAAASEVVGTPEYMGQKRDRDQVKIKIEIEAQLANRHLITRLTGNNGNFTFDAQVQLSFDATDEDGNTAVHNAASRGDNEMILYLVSKGADVKKVNRRGQTTVDMANGPVQRTQPYPETIKLLMSMGAKNNNRCVSC